MRMLSSRMVKSTKTVYQATAYFEALEANDYRVFLYILLRRLHLDLILSYSVVNLLGASS